MQPYWKRDTRHKEWYEIVDYEDSLVGSNFAIKRKTDGRIIAVYASEDVAERVVREMYNKQQAAMESMLLGEK